MEKQRTNSGPFRASTRKHSIYTQRDVAEFPGTWPASASGQLGRVTATGPERADRGYFSVADDSSDPGDHCRAGIQLPGRWVAGRCGSLWPLAYAEVLPVCGVLEESWPTMISP